MALNFPPSPNLNDVYTYNSKSWVWNGRSWVGRISDIISGFTGSNGFTGSIGFTGSAGFTGSQGFIDVNNPSFTGFLQVTNSTNVAGVGAYGNNQSVMFETVAYGNNATSSINFHRARGTSVSPLAVSSGDVITSFQGVGRDSGGSWTVGASISMQVAGTVSAGLVPTQIIFSTNSTNRVFIKPEGTVEIGPTSLSSTSGSRVDALKLVTTTTNGDNLFFSKIRTSTGSDWTTASWRIQQRVDSTDMGFIQFNGTSATNSLIFGTDNTERMRIASDGTVTILGPIRHDSNIDTNTAKFIYSWGGGTSGQVRAGIYFDGTNQLVSLYTAQAERLRVTSAGEVLIGGTTDNGAYNLQVNGTGVWGAGAYVNGSDYRIKEDINPIESALEIVNNLNPVTFRYKEEWCSDQSIQPGFVAQELLIALANTCYANGVVQQGPQYMSVAYQALIPVLTKALQEQQEQINSLRLEIDSIKSAQQANT